MRPKPSANAPRTTVRVVIEIDLTWPVGPESHMSCMEVLDLGGAILGIHSLAVHLKNVNFEQALESDCYILEV